MDTQRKIWEDEHVHYDMLPAIHTLKPSGPVPSYANYLVEQGLNPENTYLLDIGCGNGRNSFYLAGRGFCVTGIDFSQAAIAQAQVYAYKGAGPVHFRVHDLATPLPFVDASFQGIVDCCASICMPNPGRERMVQEVYRVLQAGGYYLFYGVCPTPLLQTNPGEELHSALFPVTGKFEKQYTRDELLETYGMFSVKTLHTLSAPTIIEGNAMEYDLWIAIFQK